MSTLLSATIEALIVAVIAIIPVITTNLIKFINVKMNKAKQETTSASEEKMLSSIEQLVTDSVNYVSQTFVDTLKASDDFGLDKQKTALKLALDNIESTLSDECKEFIMQNYGDMTTWLTTKIESTIKQSK
jgi:hypothetical protein